VDDWEEELVGIEVDADYAHLRLNPVNVIGIATC
jgi:hypothetical protein